MGAARPRSIRQPGFHSRTGFPLPNRVSVLELDLHASPPRRQLSTGVRGRPESDRGSPTILRWSGSGADERGDRCAKFERSADDDPDGRNGQGRCIASATPPGQIETFPATAPAAINAESPRASVLDPSGHANSADPSGTVSKWKRPSPPSETDFPGLGLGGWPRAGRGTRAGVFRGARAGG